MDFSNERQRLQEMLLNIIHEADKVCFVQSDTDSIDRFISNMICGAIYRAVAEMAVDDTQKINIMNYGLKCFDLDSKYSGETLFKTKDQELANAMINLSELGIATVLDGAFKAGNPNAGAQFAITLAELLNRVEEKIKKAFPSVSFNTRIGLFPVEFGRNYYDNKLYEMIEKNTNLMQLASEEMDKKENQENAFIKQEMEAEDKASREIHPYELPESKKDNDQLREIVEDFNIIEPTIEGEWRDCEDIMDHLIIPMLEIDVEVGTDLWLKLLKDFYPQEKDFAYDAFTNHPFYGADSDLFVRALGFCPELKEYLFHLSPSDNTYYAADFIQDLVIHKQYDLPDEILLLYCDNHHGEHDPEKTLYKTLSVIAGDDKSKWLIDEDGIAFVEKWMDQLTDEADKAKVRIRLRSLKQIVFEGASKGPVPLGIIDELDPTDEQVKMVKKALE